MRKKSYQRLPFIGWIILPLIGVFVATNYLMGITRRPTWAIINQNPPTFNDNTQTAVVDTKISQYKWNGEGLVTFWFDDAWLSEYTIAFPILEANNFPAALAVPTDAVGWDNYLTWAQIRRLSYNGWEITSHSRSHECDLDNYDAQRIEAEVHGSQQDLAEQGYDATVYVTPCGEEKLELIDVVKKYYVALRTSDGGFNQLPLTNTYSLKIHEVDSTTRLPDVINWVNEAKAQKNWLILMFHRVDTSGEQFSTTPEIFKNIVGIVKDSGLDVVNPSQVINMII